MKTASKTKILHTMVCKILAFEAEIFQSDYVYGLSLYSCLAFGVGTLLCRLLARFFSTGFPSDLLHTQTKLQTHPDLSIRSQRTPCKGSVMSSPCPSQEKNLHLGSFARNPIIAIYHEFW